MRCNSVQRRLSTWSNEDHSARETRAIEQHLSGCAVCSAYRQGVSKLDSMAATLGEQRLERDLRTAMPNSRLAPVRKPFAARHWVAAFGVAALLLAARLAMRHGGANTASASEALRHMATILKQTNVYHQRYFQAHGEHQEGDLELITESWYEDGKWRNTSPATQGGDRILRSEGGLVAYYHRDADGKIERMIELAPQGDDPSLSKFLQDNNLLEAAAKAEKLGPTKLDGREAEEISIPTYERQQTFVWLVPGTDVPLRIERQNLQDGSWHTSWMFTVDLADHWPASIFDPSTLKQSSDDPSTQGTEASPSDPAPIRAAWQAGNSLFKGFASHGAAAAQTECIDSSAARSVAAWLGSEVAKLGPLQGYGSVGTTQPLSVKVTTQPFDLTFGTQHVKAIVSLRRDAKDNWKVSGIADANVKP